MPDDPRRLVRRAFEMARDRGKTDWRRMTTAVLKNRMLYLSRQQFEEREFGAPTFAEFVAQLGDIVRIDNSTWPPTVEYVENLEPPPKPVESPHQRPSTGSAPLFDGNWIRPDLWRAVADATGRRYVWDDEHRIVREAVSGDAKPLFPNISREEYSRLRTEFVTTRSAALGGAALDRLLEWRDQGRPTEWLPRQLQRVWRGELAKAVRTRLLDWFAQHAPSAISPLGTPGAVDSVPATPDASPAPRIEAPKPTPSTLDDLIEHCRSTGDLLGLGELLAETFASVGDEHVEAVFAKVVVAWASPLHFTMGASSLGDITVRVPEFHEEQLASALVNAIARLIRAQRSLPAATNDLAFRLTDSICGLYDVDARFRPVDACMAAVTRLEAARADLDSAVASFLSTQAVTAKAASIAVVRASHRLARFALAAERPLLRDLDILLGAAFRKFCESCERHDSADTIRRAAELRDQLQRYAAPSPDTRMRSGLWKNTIAPVVQHVGVLLDESIRRSEASTMPDVRLASSDLKLDLTQTNRQMMVSCRLVNRGKGRASRVTLLPVPENQPVCIVVVGPAAPFDLAGETEQLITFGVVVKTAVAGLKIPVRWQCSTTTGAVTEFDDQLCLAQQHVQPDWDRLLGDPPYTINPIRRRENLFGRDKVLKDLQLHVASRTSTFLWGQKRVGKTSVLQVLVGEYAARHDVAAVVLRMGEIVALHEGQIAQRIAQRFCEAVSSELRVPGEEEFGAGLSRLVPFMEKLVAERPNVKLLLIVDEFDDLDPAFYTGERGKQFVKALRSLSEQGVTFFFVGSERMETIYARHATDLNKWASVSLDRISSREDCKALITRPVEGALEYQEAAVNFIVDYCLGNPFYMHLFCFEMFKHCSQERRTFVSESDVHVVRRALVSALGQTNFAHLWEDNPELDEREKDRQAAENCVLLTCVALLGGGFDDIDDLVNAQERLRLPSSEQLSSKALRNGAQRLRHRQVLESRADGSGTEVALPLFREWLCAHAELRVLPIWREHCDRTLAEEETGVAEPAPTVELTTFPIPEDELLAVSQRLVYCGKQKDVAEVRLWLRQFDDDNRIEMAFQLLRRLAEKGYVTEGAKVRALRTVEEMVSAKRRELGKGVWRVVRGKIDNLCVTFVDSETKSGATTAREIGKSLRPSKCGSASDIGSWMKSHAEDDPMVVVVDDFAGTGGTIAAGLKALKGHVDRHILERYIDERRVACYVLFAFPEALDRVRKDHPGLDVMAAITLGDELRALQKESGIHADEAERVFAKDVLLQIGRELTPQNPLGFGDMAALVVFHNSVPNNTLPIFWSNGTVNDRAWHPLFARA